VKHRDNVHQAETETDDGAEDTDSPRLWAVGMKYSGCAWIEYWRCGSLSDALRWQRK